MLLRRWSSIIFLPTYYSLFTSGGLGAPSGDASGGGITRGSTRGITVNQICRWLAWILIGQSEASDVMPHVLPLVMPLAPVVQSGAAGAEAFASECSSLCWVTCVLFCLSSVRCCWNCQLVYAYSFVFLLHANVNLYTHILTFSCYSCHFLCLYKHTNSSSAGGKLAWNSSFVPITQLVVQVALTVTFDLI